MDELEKQMNSIANKIKGERVFQVFLTAKKDGRDKLYISTNGEVETEEQAVKEAKRAALENGYTHIKLLNVKVIK